LFAFWDWVLLFKLVYGLVVELQGKIKIKNIVFVEMRIINTFFHDVSNFFSLILFDMPADQPLELELSQEFPLEL
jgi:hypothetical protein